MPIVITCPACNSKARVPDELMGRKVKCPKCGGVVTVTGEAPPPPPPEPVKAKSAPPPEEEEVMDEEEEEEARVTTKKKPARARDDDDDLEDEPLDEDQDEKPRRKGRIRGMEYFSAFGFPFRNQNWMMVLLLGSVCMLIPIVGPFVVNGYFCQVLVACHRKGDRSYPDFDFGKFGENLMLGLWLFVVNLLFAVPYMIVYGVVMVLAVVVGGSAGAAASSGGGGGGDAAGAIASIIMLLGYGVLLIVEIILAFLIIPAYIYTALKQGLDLGGMFGFMMDFLKKMWLEEFLSMLIFGLIAPFIYILGCLACGIGLFPAAVYLLLTATHLGYQMYEVYLSKGGQEVPIGGKGGKKKSRRVVDDEDDED